MLKANFDIPLDFLTTKTPPMIGVDISSSSVKMVEFGELPKKGGYVVERYAIEPLPKDAITDGSINNLDAVAESLQRAWKRLGSRHRPRRGRPSSMGARRTHAALDMKEAASGFSAVRPD